MINKTLFAPKINIFHSHIRFRHTILTLLNTHKFVPSINIDLIKYDDIRLASSHFDKLMHWKIKSNTESTQFENRFGTLSPNFFFSFTLKRVEHIYCDGRRFLEFSAEAHLSKCVQFAFRA